LRCLPPITICFIFSTGDPEPGTQLIDAPKITSAYPLLEPYERKLVRELALDTKGKLDGDLSRLDGSWTVRELGNIVVRINRKFGARVIDRIPKRGNAGTAYRIKDEYFQLLRGHISKDPLFAGADMTT
jgi:hypothetical protein